MIIYGRKHLVTIYTTFTQNAATAAAATAAAATAAVVSRQS